MTATVILLGLALMAAMAPIARVWRRIDAPDLGVVSAQWLAEYRQGHDW